MPLQTNRYKLEVFGLPGDAYSASADRRRSYTLENQLVSQLDIFGGGVISGLNLFNSSDPAKPFDTILEEGLAVVPFDFKNVIIDGSRTTEVIEKHHIAVRLEERNSITLNPNTVSGIFIFAPDADRMRGTFTILSISNLIRNTTTTTDDPNAYRNYTIDGNIPLGFNVRVLINSREIHGGYTLQGNVVSFNSKRLPTDIVTVRIEPHNSLLLSVIITDNDGIASIDNEVKINLREKAGDEIIGDQIRSHKHTGESGSPAKVILTTSTNYKRAESASDDNTIYQVSKSDLISGTEMLEEWAALKGNSTLISGNTLFDSTTSFLMENKVDRKRGYYLNPSINQNKFVSVVSNSSNQLVTNSNLEALASSGDQYLLVPYDIQVAINGKEEYYGYYLLDDDNVTISIKFNGSLESSDTVDVKLFYTKQQSEIQGIINVDSDSAKAAASRSINFSGENFKSGFINQDRLPQLDHTGRTKEISLPFISKYGAEGNGWKTDTFDRISYKPRTDEVNSIRNVEWIHQHKDYFYLCANNTLLRTKCSRLFDHGEMEYFSYPDIYKPTKIVEQPASEVLYALTSKMILTTKSGNWDEFVNITDDRVSSDHPYLTNLIGYTQLKDIACDSSDRIFLVADNSLLMYNPVYGKTKNWYRIAAPTNFTLSSLAVWETESNYTLFLIGSDSKDVWVSNNKILKLAQDAQQSSTSVVLNSTDGLNVGDEIIISDTEIEPQVRTITAIADNAISFNLPLSNKFISGRTVVLKQFTRINLGTVDEAVSIYVNSDNDIVINNGTSLQVIAAEEISNKTYGVDNIPASLGATITSYGYKFDSHYIGVDGVGLFRYDSDWNQVQNNLFDSSLNAYTEHILYICDTQENELYFGCEDGIAQLSTDSATDQGLILRNASIYFGRPLDTSKNVFKTRLGSGVVGITQSDNSILVSSGERSIYVNADMAGASIGDYLLFTPSGGGERVGKYLRLLSITAVSEPRKQYLVQVDNFDGTFLEVSGVKYGETFDIIPSLSPVPVINGIPQSSNYTNNINDFTFDFATQTIVFSDENDYTDDIVIATKFDTFMPVRGAWNPEKEVVVYLNGRNITNINGAWLKVSKIEVYNPATSTTSVKTKLFAQNTIFRGLNLAGIVANVNTSKNLLYVVESNNESSLTLAGDFYDVITSSGAVASTEIPFNISLVTYNEDGDGDYESLELISPVASEDRVSLTIKNVYIGAGSNSHEELEDHFSEEHTGFKAKLDAVRNSNLLQLYSNLNNFITSIPEDLGTNIDHVDFSDINVFDLINSTVENSKLYDSEVNDYEVAFNVFGLLYSSMYGGLYALTERGVFFKADATDTNTFPKWEKLTEFFDTINAQGIREPDSDNPGGFYIGFNEDTNIWKISWGGFHTSEAKNSGLSDIKVVDIHVDSQNSSRFYLATENHGILKTEDGGITFRSVFNASAFNFDKNKIVQLRFHPVYSFVAHLVTENGLYRTIDGCENFELLLDHNSEDSIYPEVPKAVELFIGPNGNDFDIYYGASSLYYRNSDTEVSPSQELNFNRLRVTDITFEDVFNLNINDIKVNPANRNHIYLATNNGVYRTLQGIGRDMEFLVIDAEDVFENGVPYSNVTVNAVLDTLDIPPGTYVLPNKLNAGRTYEVASIITGPSSTQIKLKGTSVRSTTNPLVKRGDIFVAKRWGKINSGLNDLDILNIDFNPLTNTILCGTKTNGIYSCTNQISWNINNSGLSISDEDEVICVSKIKVIGYDIYASIRSNNTHTGGLFIFNNITENWQQLASYDVLSFHVEDTTIMIGTSDGAYQSNDSGETWQKITIPSENVTALDWASNSFSSVAGTGGMGIFSGSSLGESWKQRFSKASILSEVKALSWRILDIYEDETDSSSPLRVAVQPISNNINSKSTKQSLESYKQKQLDTNDYEWTSLNPISISPANSLWIDPCNYAYMASQNLKSNLLNKDLNLGILHNGFKCDPYASERFLILLNDHQIQDEDYRNSSGDVLSRQGGLIVSDAQFAQTFQGSNITPSRSERVSSLRTFKINDLVKDGSGNVFAATENAGVYKLIPTSYADTYFGQGEVNGTQFTNSDLNLLTINVSGYFIDLVSGTSLYSDTVTHASGSIFDLVDAPDDDTYSYAISNIKILKINEEETFDLARLSPSFSTPSDYGSTLQDKITVITSETTFSDTPEVGSKLYFSPHSAANADVYSANTPFIISAASLLESDTKLELTVDTYDVKFDSGNSLIEVINVIHNDISDDTILTLAESAPIGVSNWGNIRFQPNINVAIITTAKSVSDNKITLADPDGIIYNAITTTSSSGFGCRFNYGITYLDGSVQRIPYIQAPYSITELDSGLASYKNGYSEYKINFIKLLSGTELYAAVQPVGIMKFNGTTWSKITSFTDKHPIDLDWSSESGTMYICTRNKVYCSDDLVTWNDITPNINTPKFNSLKCVAGSDSECYIATEYHGIYHTSDKGSTWTAINEGLDINTCPQWKFTSDQEDISNVFAYGFGSGIFKRVTGFEDEENTFTDANKGLLNRNVSDLWVSGVSGYAATATGGLFKTTDGTVTWTPITSAYFESNLIKNVTSFSDATDIVLCVVQKDELTALSRFGKATGENLTKTNNSTSAIYKSIDGGLTWELALDVNTKYTTELVSFSDGVVFFGTQNKIYKSADYGETFELVLDDVFKNVYSISKTNGKSNEVLASLDGGKIAISFDSGNTWIIKSTAATQPYLDVAAIADSNPITLLNKQVITYSNPTPIQGFIADIESDTFKISNTSNTYYDFAGASVRFINGSEYELESIGPTISRNPGFRISNLGNTGIKEGDYCEIFGFSKIVIYGPESDYILLDEKKSLWVNLYVKINNQSPLKISQYTYDANQDAIIIHAIGSMDSDVNEVCSIKIGWANGNEIEPPTTIFFTSGFGDFSYAPSITLNYFDSLIRYTDDIYLRQSESTSAFAYGRNMLKAGWANASNNAFYLLTDDRINAVTNADGSDPVVSQSNLHATLTASGTLLANGFTKDSTRSYVSKSDGVYLNSDPESNGAWSKLTNNSYFGQSGNRSFSSVSYPLTIAQSDNDCAYIIVDDQILLQTLSLSSWINGGDTIWYQKSLRLTNQSAFRASWIKSLKIHPANSNILFACVDNGSLNSTFNGLYASKDGGATWTKLFVNTDPTTPALDMCFLDATGDKILVSSGTEDACSIYANVLGTVSDENIGSVSISDSIIVSASRFGISLIDRDARIGSTLLFSDLISFITASDTYLFVGMSGKVLTFPIEELENGLLSESSIKEISFSISNAVNSVYTKGNNTYFCTNKGVYYCAESLLNNNISETQLQIIFESIGFEASDIVIDENNEIWISTATGLIRKSGLEYVIYNSGNSIIPNNISCLGYIPKSIAVAQNEFVEFFIPNTVSEEQITIVKSYGRETIDQIINGEEYNSAIFDTISSFTYDDITDITTITVENSNLGESDSLVGRIAILDRNFSNPRTITGSTASSIVISGSLSTGNSIAIYDTIAGNDYVLYSGAIIEEALLDNNVSNNELFSYDVYYRSGDNYILSFSFSVNPAENRIVSNSTSALLIGTDQGAFVFSYEKNEFNSIATNSEVKKIINDNYFNAHIVTFSSIIKYNNAVQQTVYTDADEINNVCFQNNTMHVSTSAGVKIVEDSNIEDTLTSSYITYDVLGGENYFQKIYSTTDDAITKISFINNLVYGISNNTLYKAESLWFGLQPLRLESDANKPLINIISANSMDSTLVFGSGSLFYSQNAMTPPKKLFTPTNIRAFNAPFTSYYCDGYNLFASISEPEWINNGEVHFTAFKLNNETYYKEFNSASNAFNNGTGLACNSYNGVVYQGATCLDFDENENLWIGAKGSVYVRPASTNVWIKLGFDNLGKNETYGSFTNGITMIGNLQSYIPVSINKMTTPSGDAGIMLSIMSNNSIGFNSGNNLYRTDNRFNTALKTAISTYFIKYDTGTFTGYNLSKGFFEEYDPYITASNIDQISPVQYDAIVKSRSRAVNIHSHIFAPILGNDHCEIQNLLLPFAFDHSDTDRIGDIGTKIGYNTILEDDYDLPYNFGRKSLETKTGVIEKYRPFRSLIVEFDTSDSEIIYIVGFNPGEEKDLALETNYSQIYKTVDGGINWFETNIGGDLFAYGKISDLAIDRENVYLSFISDLEEENGIYSSDDGGYTFTNITGDLPTSPVSSVYKFGNTLYAGVLGFGLYKSTTDEVWIRDEPRFTQRIGLGLSNGYINDLDISNQNSKLIYAATNNNGVIRSLDSGDNWQFDVGGLPSVSCTSIKIAPFNESIVWLGTEEGFYYKNQITNKWSLNESIPASERVRFITYNDSLKQNIVNLSYIIPDLSAQGILILRKEQTKISYVPQDGAIHVTDSSAGDAFVVFDGPLPAPVSGLVEIQDEQNIKPGIEYYYDFYTYKYEVVNSSLQRVYTKFPDLFTYEVDSFTDTSISINTEVSGEVETATYNSTFEVTIIENPSRLVASESTTYFGTELIGKTAIFTLLDSSIIEAPITEAYYGTIHIAGDYAEELSGATFIVDLEMNQNYSDYILNPNIYQLQNPSSNGQEITFSIKENTTSVLTIKESGINSVPDMRGIILDNFGNKNSIQFAITSSKKIKSTVVCPVYVVTNNGMYYSVNNGITFTQISLSSIGSNNINHIEFLNQKSIIDISETKAYLAGDAGLYYTEDHFGSFASDKTHEDGSAYTYVQTDDSDSKIVYAIRDNTLVRSTNGGIDFIDVETILNDEIINEAIYLHSNTNYLLCGSVGGGVFLVKDSVRDKFEINLETDISFENLTYSKFKIGDTITSDANSMSISSVLRPNSLNDEVNSIEFTVPNGNYIKAHINYNDAKADPSIIHIGADAFNPSSNPFRLRVPDSITGPSIGFSLVELPDNTLIAATNKGAYYSKNGRVWTKIDNFLIPDIIYTAARLQNGYTYLGTNNGAWLNKTTDIINFNPKDQLGRKVRAFWSFKRGNKNVVFMGGEEGLRIKFQNYPNIIVTTPQNFDKDDGIRLTWGEEDENGNYNPGGLDNQLLEHLNAERTFEDPCIRGSNKTVTANGWSGTLLVRYEGSEDNGFSPQNQTVYEAEDRRYVDAIRQKEFDITPEDADIGEVIKTAFGFPDGLVIVDNIRAAADRETIGVISGPNQDTFTPDNPYIDTVSITAEDDVENEFGANPDGTKNADGTYVTSGAELKPDTTYIYTLFAYYLRPPNFVFESTEGGCRWIPMYSRVNIKEYSINIPMSQFPNATTITCGAALSETHFLIGTDDGLFYTNTNVGIRKSSGTDNNIVNCILLTERILEESNYSYIDGYGYGFHEDGNDFFDVFGIDGYGVGYSEHGTDTYTTYGFGQGYELTLKKSILIGTNVGIFVSTNGGMSFTKIFDNDTNSVRMVFSLTEDSNGDIYAGTDRGIFKKDSVDNTVWTFDSIVGTADIAPLGRIIGQSFTIDEI